jgi:hypothetical protein
MAQPRRSLIKLHDTPYYHVSVRCVRRAWLSGVDASSGKDYSHRAAWLLERMAQLAAVFCIDVGAYAIMRNYYEAVLHVDRARGTRWTAQEVIQRWCTLYRAPKLIAGWQSGTLAEPQREAAQRLIEQWRAQLCDISWFMRCLNEYLARRANAEDGCTGAFWETRFKCRALDSEASLLAAMAYVDLSPVRAPASAPGISGSTSIQARIEHSVRATTAQPNLRLLQFAAPLAARASAILPFNFRDYLELLDWTGRKLPIVETVALDTPAPHVLQRMSIDPATWLLAMKSENNGLARPLERLRRHVERSARPAAVSNDNRGAESGPTPPSPP